MSEKLYCLVLRMNIDCDGCYKRIRRALLQIHDLDSHWIEKKENKVTVCGSFDPQAFAIKMRALTNRRVEILQATELLRPSAAPSSKAPRPLLSNPKTPKATTATVTTASTAPPTAMRPARRRKRRRRRRCSLTPEEARRRRRLRHETQCFPRIRQCSDKGRISDGDVDVTINGPGRAR
ncbi:unnamed protein product [Spirodela intermedia]|uniref:Uncharacterized protein n=1 Tax=Spirodela intermedia TaxID=51605 RepID=A0A7I8IPI1_SPIIN|nr:unnamed protein product [Spirodela intermedia]CAA6659393.1 unnamed protein product [Spirodela intermedia]